MNVLGQALEPDEQPESLPLFNVRHCLSRQRAQPLLQGLVTLVSWLKISVGWIWSHPPIFL
jgi:hypothetical protein